VVRSNGSLFFKIGGKAVISYLESLEDLKSFSHEQTFVASYAPINLLLFTQAITKIKRCCKLIIRKTIDRVQDWQI
jgi:hypothetical protein